MGVAVVVEGGGGGCVFCMIGGKVHPQAIWRALFLHENRGQKRVEERAFLKIVDV